jgi:dipeptide/tripeptide permease
MARDAAERYPPQIKFIVASEGAERFSYYGMRAILVYYMTKQLLFAQERASQIYGLYTGFVYFTPFFGGMLADRLLGQRRTVILGAVLMAIGHFLMTVEQMFFPALIFLILGNGVFKPISRRKSGRCTLPETIGATGPSASSTWESTSARSCPRWSAARWDKR